LLQSENAITQGTADFATSDFGHGPEVSI